MVRNRTLTALIVLALLYMASMASAQITNPFGEWVTHNQNEIKFVGHVYKPCFKIVPTIEGLRLLNSPGTKCLIGKHKDLQIVWKFDIVPGKPHPPIQPGDLVLIEGDAASANVNRPQGETFLWAKYPGIGVKADKKTGDLVDMILIDHAKDTSSLWGWYAPLEMFSGFAYGGWDSKEDHSSDAVGSIRFLTDQTGVGSYSGASGGVGLPVGGQPGEAGGTTACWSGTVQGNITFRFVDRAGITMSTVSNCGFHMRCGTQDLLFAVVRGETYQGTRGSKPARVCALSRGAFYLPITGSVDMSIDSLVNLRVVRYEQESRVLVMEVVSQ